MFIGLQTIKKFKRANATGAPNDGFLQNTLKTLFRLSRVLLVFLEIHSNRRYNIHISSVILGQLASFRNYQGFSRWYLKFYESEIFLIPFSIAFSNPKILGFLFLRKMAKLSSERRKPSGNRREFIR